MPENFTSTTHKEDVVLDPFCGSGTTCVSALKDGRNYIGYDIKPEYVDLSNKRIDEIKYKLKQKTLFR